MGFFFFFFAWDLGVKFLGLSQSAAKHTTGGVQLWLSLFPTSNLSAWICKFSICNFPVHFLKSLPIVPRAPITIRIWLLEICQWLSNFLFTSLYRSSLSCSFSFIWVYNGHTPSIIGLFLSLSTMVLYLRWFYQLLLCYSLWLVSTENWHGIFALSSTFSSTFSGVRSYHLIPDGNLCLLNIIQWPITLILPC